MSIRAFTLPVLAGLLVLAAVVEQTSAPAIAQGRVNVVVRAVDGATPVPGTFSLSGLSEGSAPRVSFAAQSNSSVSLPAGAYRLEWRPELSAGAAPSALEGLTTERSAPQVIVVAPNRATTLIAQPARDNALVALAH